MSVDAIDPNDEEPEDESLADDDTPVKDIPIEVKKGSTGRPIGMTKQESVKLSEQIWQEYAGGMSMQQIGDLHGITLPAVWQRITKYRASIPTEDIEAAKALDLGRYEALFEKVWERAHKDPSPENVRSAAMLMDQKAKLLGLNAPRKLHVDGQVALTPSPTMVIVLDRLAEERNRLSGDISRPAIEGSGDVVEAELVDDP